MEVLLAAPCCPGLESTAKAIPVPVSDTRNGSCLCGQKQIIRQCAFRYTTVSAYICSVDLSRECCRLPAVLNATHLQITTTISVSDAYAPQ